MPLHQVMIILLLREKKAHKHKLLVALVNVQMPGTNGWLSQG